MSRRCIFVHRSLKKQTWRALWKSSTAVFGSNELIGILMSLSIGSFENYSNFLCSGLRCVHIFWPPRILKLQLLGRFLIREVCNNTFRCIFLQFFLWAQTLIYDISKAAIKIRIPMFVNSQKFHWEFFAGIIGVLKLSWSEYKVRCLVVKILRHSYFQSKCVTPTSSLIIIDY